MPLNLMFALNLCSISELLVKKSERANCENRCRGNNLLSEQRFNNCKSSEHSEIPRKAREAYKLDKVDRFHGSAARKDAVKTFYPVNSVLTHVSHSKIAWKAQGTFKLGK